MSIFPEAAVDKLLRDLQRNDLLVRAATGAGPLDDLVRQARTTYELSRPALASVRAAFDASDHVARSIEDAGGISVLVKRSQSALTAVELAMRDIDRTPRLFREMVETQRTAAAAFALADTTAVATQFAAAARLQSVDTFSAFAGNLVPDDLADVRQRMIEDHKRFQNYVTGALPHIERLQREMTAPTAMTRCLSQVDEFAALARSLEYPIAAAMRSLHDRDLTASDYARMQTEAFGAFREASELIDQYVSSDDAPDADFLHNILQGLIAIMARFVANGSREGSEIGPISLFGYMLGVIGILLAIFPPESEADRETAKTLARLEESMASLAQTMSDHDADNVAGLDRAIILRAAWVRAEPRKRGGRIMKLHEGTIVALREKSGPWWQIAYRDPLSGKIADGWIYETLVKENE